MIRSILEHARKNHYGIASPIAFNVECLHRMIIVSHETQQPIFVRIDENYLKLPDVIHWIEEFQPHYPLACIKVVTEHVCSYEDALRAIISHSDILALDENVVRDTGILAKIKKIAEMQGILLQTQTKLSDIKSISHDIDIIKLKVETNDNSIEETCDRIRKITDDASCFYAIDDMKLSKDDYKKLKSVGISKFDVYETLSDECMDEIEQIYKNDTNRSDRFYVFKLKEGTMDHYCKGVQARVYQIGPFIIR